MLHLLEWRLLWQAAASDNQPSHRIGKSTQRKTSSRRGKAAATEAGLGLAEGTTERCSSAQGDKRGGVKKEGAGKAVAGSTRSKRARDASEGHAPEARVTRSRAPAVPTEAPRKTRRYVERICISVRSAFLRILLQKELEQRASCQSRQRHAHLC